MASTYAKVKPATEYTQLQVGNDLPFIQAKILDYFGYHYSLGALEALEA
jgi:hypothetical protein